MAVFITHESKRNLFVKKKPELSRQKVTKQEYLHNYSATRL